MVNADFHKTRQQKNSLLYKKKCLFIAIGTALYINMFISRLPCLMPLLPIFAITSAAEPHGSVYQ